MKAYQIKISLKGSKPLIWRRVLVPELITFKRLHETIQHSMGWLNYHLFLQLQVVERDLAGAAMNLCVHPVAPGKRLALQSPKSVKRRPAMKLSRTKCTNRSTLPLVCGLLTRHTLGTNPITTCPNN